MPGVGGDDESDVVRRKREISMFAAFASGEALLDDSQPLSEEADAFGRGHQRLDHPSSPDESPPASPVDVVVENGAAEATEGMRASTSKSARPPSPSLEDANASFRSALAISTAADDEPVPKMDLNSANAAFQAAISATSKSFDEGEDESLALDDANAAFKAALHSSVSAPADDQTLNDSNTAFLSAIAASSKSDFDEEKEGKESSELNDANVAFQAALQASAAASDEESLNCANDAFQAALRASTTPDGSQKSAKKEPADADASFQAVLWESSSANVDPVAATPLTSNVAKPKRSKSSETKNKKDGGVRRAQVSLYGEKVLLPRPLFFGHILPPRVIKEAQRVAMEVRGEAAMKSPLRSSADSLPWSSEGWSSATADAHHTSPLPSPDRIAGADREGSGVDDSPSANDVDCVGMDPPGTGGVELGFSPRTSGKVLPHPHPLRSPRKQKTGENGDATYVAPPPSYRNFEGAISAFACGMDPFERPAAQRVPHPYVSTYQPVWGDAARKEREEKRKGVKKVKEADNVEVEQQRAPLSGDEAKKKLDEAKKKLEEKKNVSLGRSYRSEKSVSQASDVPVGEGKGVEEDSTAIASQALETTTAPGQNTIEDSPANISQSSGEDAAAGKKSKTEPAVVSATVMSTPPSSVPLPMSESLFSQWARNESDGPGTFVGVASPAQSQGAAPPSQSGSSSGGFSIPQTPSDTFRQIQGPAGGDSKDTLVNAKETKNDVGINDNLSAALASLAGGEEAIADAPVVGSSTEPMGVIAEVTTNEKGRPLTNLELTKGCVPLYGCDDTPLPIEADLGIFETKDEQVKSVERRKEQDTIENRTVPSVFGPVACPSQCIDLDDNHSWNSRAVLRRNGAGGDDVSRVSTGKGGGSSSLAPDNSGTQQRKAQFQQNSQASSSSVGGHSAPAALEGKPSDPPPPPHIGTDPANGKSHKSASENSFQTPARAPQTHSSSASLSASTPKKQLRTPVYETTRVAWWNVPGAEDDNERPATSLLSKENDTCTTEETFSSFPSMQVFPAQDDPIPLDVSTNLSPSPLELRDNNFSMSRLHPATSTARLLPYLSDRPPSTRYLQIDTQAVGFPKLGGEIEPLFCTLAIYHVELTPSTGSGGSSRSGRNAAASTAAVAPVPNMTQCGRVTECLNFDIVSDPDVEEMCSAALWPVDSAFDPVPKSGRTQSGSSIADIQCREMSKTVVGERLQSTRCGVFPLPTNLSIHNLYAILIVHKVLAEGAEVEPYLKPARRSGDSKASLKNLNLDLPKLRAKAEKSSERLGRFLMPFSFGVAPLSQVIGTEIPSVPNSRAVQIPLFKLAAGRGIRPIVDHISYMTYPRTGVAAEVTNGGQAMLVMRNFGYLGLHSVIHSKSSLARDRLVDFTGEVQVRRCPPKRSTQPDNDQDYYNLENDKMTYAASHWHSDFIAEPTVNGGRNSICQEGVNQAKAKKEVDGGKLSPVYAQELAPLPLSFSPSTSGSRAAKLESSSRGGRSQRGSFSGEKKVGSGDAEPYFYTSFCNELLCQPRLLHNCLKRNIVVKVEVRQVKWSEALKMHVALLPDTGPSIHNPRRGTFMVHAGFTSCAYHTVDPHFMDEFKIKLPLALDSEDSGRLVLFFSVYNISVKGKKRWTKAFLGMKGSEELDIGDEESTPSATVDLLGCGLAPLALDSSPTCLLANGLHDVKLNYISRPAPTSVDNPTPNPSPSRHRRTGSSSSAGSSYSQASDFSRLVAPMLPSNVVTFPPGTLVLAPLKAALASTPQENVGPASSASETGFEVSLSPKCDGESRVSAGSISGLSETFLTENSPDRRREHEIMVLQVRTFALSSVHPQNPSLAKFFLRKPKPPRPLSDADRSGPAAPWTLSRDKLLHHAKPERIPQSSYVGGELAEAERKLLQPTIDLSKSSSNCQADITSHFLRVVSQLWRQTVTGAGEPSLFWANPASLIPLRMYSFATLLHCLNSVAVFMSKNGVTQLDGRGKLSLTAMGKIVAMLFDEELLFLGPLEDAPQDIGKKGKAATSKRIGSSSNDDKEGGILRERGRGHSRHERLPDKRTWLSAAAHTATLDKDDPYGTKGMNLIAKEFPIPAADPSAFEDDSPFDRKKAMTLSLPLKGEARGAVGGAVNKPEKAPTSQEDDHIGQDSASKSVVSSLSSVSSAGEFKIDSKSDFQAALNAASSMDDSSLMGSFPSASTSGSRAAMNMISAFGGTGSGGPAANRRKWMTAPSSALATIQEDEANDRTSTEVLRGSFLSSAGSLASISEGTEDNLNKMAGHGPGNDERRGDALDTELVLVKPETNKPKRPVKQMRVPKLNSSPSSDSSIVTLESAIVDVAANDSPSAKKKSLPATDEEIETAGTAFLDVIGKNLGYGLAAKDMGGEEKRVGYAHHRKTRSRCSIDWTLPPTDVLLENEQQMEQLNRRGQAGILSPTSAGEGDITDDDTDTTITESDIGSSSFELTETKPLSDQSLPKEKAHPFKRSASTGSDSKSKTPKKRKPVVLPNFVDRIVAMGKKKGQGRWFPFVYEVIIFQWVTLLSEQTKSSEQPSGSSGNAARSSASPTTRKSKVPGRPPIVKKCLADSAAKARGVTISCAPILFEIIKKSLAWRIENMFCRRKQDLPSSSPSSEGARIESPHPLVKLDDSLLSTLEELISMVTDACIDSRNFDSFQFRQTSIDVNDSIIRFLRDLFAFLEPSIVHRLVLVYFSRFVMKEGKHWHNRDSKIGLRCSWETAKLRLNAITLFVRFPEFLKVNFPLMETWDSWPMSAPSRSTRRFFTNALEQLETFDMSAFAASEPVSRSAVKIPSLKPHWLAELVTDVCLSATGHVEQSIQHRASSLLHELFWSQSQEGRAAGNLSVVASMHVPFLVKVLGHISYLSSLPAKSQLRKDILPCAVFVMQSAPVGLMRALWRKLSKRAEGKGNRGNFGGFGGADIASLEDINVYSKMHKVDDGYSKAFDEYEETDLPTILDVFSLLNLALKTFEYEGSERNIEEDTGYDSHEQQSTWRREFLLAIEHDGYANATKRPRPFPSVRQIQNEKADEANPSRYTTSSSRKWHAHDGASVIINSCRYIVRETLCMLRPSVEGEVSGSSFSPSLSVSKQLSDSFIEQPSSFSSLPGSSTMSTRDDSKTPMRKYRRSKSPLKNERGESLEVLSFSVADTIIFARAATSVYLHSLSLRQSDIVIVKTLIASVEIVKIFGIKVFLSAVGETLQHWMRVVLVHCGARRPEVRVQALEFLALILRLTWDSFGSFYRVRMPLLAVQTEVMERIVATAARRYYREQRRVGTTVQCLSNDRAEASLAPLWRTIDRLHNQSASQNIAFKSALMRLADMMKKLFRAYIAAHALAIVNRVRSSSSPGHNDEETNPLESSLVQDSRVTVHRIIAASAGFSKQFLGLMAHSVYDCVTHSEAVEDAFLAAADVFSPTELPSHRVAWLRHLAEFHKTRSKFGEEATCRFYIQSTLRQAARLHDSLWNSVPFLPWATDSSDGVHPDGEGPAGEPGDYYDLDYDLEDFSSDGTYDPNLDMMSGKQIEKNNSFRRIFFRVANSVRMRTGDWDVGGNKFLFYGVTFASEFNTVPHWISLREMEEDMVEEAETAGDLYLKAGIVESSRYAWSLATQFYSETFNYARLAYVYRRLAVVVASQVPVVDTSNQVELSSPLGRFYKVWFHGGAPDDLIGNEFVYRAPVSVKLEEFGYGLKNILKSILGDNTPIDLVLDDGRPEEPAQRRPNQRRPLGAAPLDPIKMKITPLRPLMKKEKFIRGSPAWFYDQTEYAGFSTPSAVQSFGGKETIVGNGEDRSLSRFATSPRHRSGARSFSTSLVTSSNSSSILGRVGRPSTPSVGSGSGSFALGGYTDLTGEVAIMGGGKLVGVDKFSFTQPIKKDRLRGSRDWLKASGGDFAEKSLRVTELQVEKCFPACVSRQAVVHRAVFNQSPLEAGVEAVCSWCAVLFRTAVASNGQAVLGTQTDQGLGTAAAKVVADCIHSSRVKDIGQALLNKNGYVAEEGEGGYGSMMLQYARLSDMEIIMHQIKLARAIIIFMELLHLLIARNRDLLLDVVQARKRSGASVASSSIHGGMGQRGGGHVSSPDSAGKGHRRQYHSTSSNSNYEGQIPSSEGVSSRSYMESVGPGTGSGSIQSAGGAMGSDRTDSAIALQSELQRAFIAMAKVLYPIVSSTIHSETPRWMKLCAQDNYFSSGTYKQTRISMGEELFFFGGGTGSHHEQDDERLARAESYGIPISIIPAATGGGGSSHGSFCESTTSRNSDLRPHHRARSPSYGSSTAASFVYDGRGMYV